MSSEPRLEELADDELVARRIPPDRDHFQPPDRVTSANFKIDRKRGDRGLSVYRLKIVSAEQILADPDAISGSVLVVATVGAIRSLVSGGGKHLGLQVVADDSDGDNPGHALILGAEPGRLPRSASDALRGVFGLLASNPAERE